MKELHMRMTAAILVGALGLAASAVSANAAPILAPANQHDTNIVQVAGGCGPGLHPTGGRCGPEPLQLLRSPSLLGRCLSRMALAERQRRERAEQP